MMFTAARRARAQATTTPARRPRPSRRKTRGQSLVEFALIFPLFIILLLSIIEFMFLFNAQLSLNYATRDASLIAAEAGNNANADCQILQQVDKDLNPADGRDAGHHGPHLQRHGDGRAVERSQGADLHARRVPRPCGSFSVPYSIVDPSTQATYPSNVRCSDLDRTGCSPANTGPGNTGVDIIGVRIDYGYHFVTPLGSAIALVGGGQPLWGGAGMTMSTGNAMRMEPIL